MNDLMTNLKNKLIIYKSTKKLSKEIVIQIQELLLNGRKIDEFKIMIDKIDKLYN